MKPRSQQGFTLIEMIVVVIIIALIMTGVGLSIGATDRVKLRSSCYKLASAIKYAYSHSVTQGVTTRLVMDFENRTIRLEETSGRVVLNRADETGEGLRREDEELFDPDAGPEGATMLDSRMGNSSFGSPSPMGGSGMGMGMGGGMGMGLGGDDSGMGMSNFMDNVTGGHLSDPFLSSMQHGMIGDPAGYRRPTFKPISGPRGKVRELEGDTQYLIVFTPHAPIPQEDGRAYIYFFPGGVTEHSIVQLSDGDERIYSIEVHPITGRTIIHNEAVEPDGDLDDLQEAEE